MNLQVKLQLVERAYYSDDGSASNGADDVGVKDPASSGFGTSTSTTHVDPAQVEAARWAAAIKPMLSAAGLMAFLSLDQVNDAAHRREMDADALLQLQQRQVRCECHAYSVSSLLFEHNASWR